MRGRDVRQREDKQPAIQSMSPHWGLPIDILKAMAEDGLVPRNPHFLVFNPLSGCVGCT